MSEHAKEPWAAVMREPAVELAFYEIQDANGQYIDHMDDEADARRIVACVNYCVGIRTDVMEAVVPTYGGARALENVDRLREQRDQLLAALKDMTYGAERYVAATASGVSAWSETHTNGPAALRAVRATIIDGQAAIAAAGGAV